MSTRLEPDKEIQAITIVYSVLKDLEAQAQSRVIEYVLKKLNLSVASAKLPQEQTAKPSEKGNHDDQDASSADQNLPEQPTAQQEFTGISPVAQRWMQRNGLDAQHLNSVYSLGGEEIDLIANKVPGKSTRAKMRNVFLLKGVAAYLGGGAARIAHDKVRETCMHYAAYDRPNFSKNLKEFAPDVSGTKESGYTLTPRGLANAAELLKQMLGIKHSESGAE